MHLHPRSKPINANRATIASRKSPHFTIWIDVVVVALSSAFFCGVIFNALPISIITGTIYKHARAVSNSSTTDPQIKNFGPSDTPDQIQHHNEVSPPTSLTKLAGSQQGKNFTAGNGMEMVWVPPLNGWVGKYLVTQEEYADVMGYNPSKSRHPAEPITWNEGIAYCKKLTDRDHVSGALDTNYKYNLPTDEQYSLFVGDARLNDAITSLEGNRSSASDVGSKEPNKYGLYDTRGNEWEWCLDWYDDKIQSKDWSPSNIDGGKKYKVLRGGSWCDYGPEELNVSYRSVDIPSSRAAGYGFRCVVIPTP